VNRDDRRRAMEQRLKEAGQLPPQSTSTDAVAERRRRAVGQQLRAAAVLPVVRRGPKRNRRDDEAAEERGELISLRVTPSAKAAIDAAAAHAGIPRSDYIRVKVLGGEPLRAARVSVVHVEAAARLKHEIGKLGNNVNQLAKLAHEGRGPFSKEEGAAAVAAILEMRDAVLTAMGAKQVPE
jgi:hypothetical protein